MLFRKLIFFIFFLLAGCSGTPRVSHQLDARFQRDLDQKPILLPKKRRVSENWDRFYQHGVRQIYRAVDLSNKFEAIGDIVSGSDGKEAEDVNRWGEVADSSWFTNRVGKPSFELSQWMSQARPHLPPSLKGFWTVISGKVDGVSPGFVIRDSREQIFFVKFDPPGNPEMASGAEVISSLFYYLLGYNVPEYHVVEAPLAIFRLGADAVTKGKYGKKRRMTDEDLQRVLSSVDTYGKNTVRMSVSRLIEGQAMGPFSFDGKRADDPNHRIENQNRRSLRGFHLFSAWLNNTDIRPQNTLDVYQGAAGEGYVKHYFLDFGTSLGSAGDRAKNERTGYEYFFDFPVVLSQFIALGTAEPYWSKNQLSAYSSIGLFESKQFDPQLWRPDYSNQAFESITRRDGYWATKKLLSLNRKLIDEVLRQAHFSDVKAVHYLRDKLIERQLKFAETWFRKVTPLDDFFLERVATNHWRLQFNNLASSVWKEPFTITQSLRGKAPKTALKTNFIEWAFASDELGERQFSIELHLHSERDELGAGVEIGILCSDTDTCMISDVRRF